MSRYAQYDDLLQFRFLANPAFSPDGRYVAYVVSRASAEKNAYESDIWLYDTQKNVNRQLTFTHSEKTCAWDADGSLIFSSRRDNAPKGSTCFYRLPMEGGEAARLLTIEHPASAIQALGGDRYLVTAWAEPSYPNPENADYMVIEQLPFTSNGKGFVCQRRTALWLCDASGNVKRLTPEHMEVTGCALSGDRKKALLVATDYVDVKPTLNHVYELNLETNELSCLSAGLAFAFKDAQYWRDSVLVVGCDQKTTGVNQNVQFFELNNASLRCLTPELDSSLHNSVGSDCRYGIAEGHLFAVDGDRVIFCATDRFVSRLYALGSDGAITPLTSRLSTVDCWSWQSGRAAIVGFEGLNLQELYMLDVHTPEIPERQLTQHNAAMNERVLSQPEHVVFDNGEGWELDGWVMKPVNYEAGKKYPTILHIHGGPKSAFGGNYFHEMQCWAAQGYAVIYTNPRGGDGRPGGFDDIRGYYGVKDYHDIMAFTDWCAAHCDFIDAENMGVTGGSYGGYMTNWIVTQTHRFKAAVSQRSISNWLSKFGCCDIGYYYVEDQHLGTPWRTPELAWQESPLKHVANVKTPILLIQSNEDFRCERDQAFQMFTALKTLGVECRMCLFNGDNHELSRSGQPRNRLARLREITSWFDGHLSKV